MVANILPINVVEIHSGGCDPDPDLGRIKDGDDGGCHECQKERLKDEHGEDSLVEDTSRKPNVEDDQLHQPVNDVSIHFRKWTMRSRSNSLQLINAPMVVDSRQLNPANRAATEHPPNLPI